MLISPPFLPDNQSLPADGAFIEAQMNYAGRGAFPVSRGFMWHGGLHLQTSILASNAEGTARAIVDGTVKLVVPPTPKQTCSPGNLEAGPLNYANGWTDNGCVVIEHHTQIGDGVDVTFYSIYQHLHQIDPKVVAGQAIWRKDPVGQPGYIYGKPYRMHFEIVCDDANLAKLAGRSTGAVDTSKDGRTNAVFGDAYIRVPSGAAIYADDPQDPAPVLVDYIVQRGDTGYAIAHHHHMTLGQLEHANPHDNLNHIDVGDRLRVAATGHQAASAAHRPTPVGHTGEDTFVGIHYHRGDATLTSYVLSTDGIDWLTRACKPEGGVEYDLYKQAGKRFPGCPSAGFDVLRWGRVISEGLTLPADQTVHWRKIAWRDGEAWKEGYVDLNATGTTKYSDADFPQWRGWALVDDDTDGSSRCDSAMIKNMILNGDGACHPESALLERMQLPEVKAKLAKVIAKFPTEWEPGTAHKRYAWLKTDEAISAGLLPEPMTDESFTLLKKHDDALSFFKGLDLDGTHWHFNPVEFVKLFKRCGWLSLKEMRQTLPARSRAAGKVSWPETLARFQTGRIQRGRYQTPANVWLGVNRAFQKYGINDDLRRSHFLAQAFQEVGAITYFHEHGGTDYLTNMYEHCTVAFEEDMYDRHKSKHDAHFEHHKAELESKYNMHPMTASDYRRKWAEEHAASRNRMIARMGNTHPGDGPRFRGRGMVQLTWRSNYAAYAKFCNKDYTTDPNPTLLQSSADTAADSAGWYWTAGGALGKCPNEIADKGATDVIVKAVTGDVNGGETGLANREEYFVYLWHFLRDAPNVSVSGVTVLQTMQRP